MAQLPKDLSELLAHNIITQQTATDIEKYYAAKQQPQINIMLTIFGVFGGLLTGLGIILIFAHNWDNFSKGIKVGLAVLPLICFQALAAYTIIKGKSIIWKETAATLLFCTVGASIALMAQIYNISGDMAAFLQTWILLTLPLVYLLHSNAVAILLVAFSTWFVTEAGYFTTGYPYMYLLSIAALLPFYFKLLKNSPHSRMAYILSWLMPLSTLTALGAFLDGAGEFGFIIYMAFIGLLYNIGILPYFNNVKYRLTGYLILGEVGIITVFLVCSFRWIWMEIALHPASYPFVLVWITLLVINAFLMFWRKGNWFTINLKWATLLFPVLYYIALINVPLAAIVSNLVVLGFGVLFIRDGINKLQLRTLNFSLLILAILTACRFFDTNLSYIVRGLLFLTVGIGFFAANYIVLKKKKLNNAHHEN